MLQHQPVLLTEVLENLAIKSDGIYIDATFGRGGHAKAILERLGLNGKLFAIDKDPAAINHAKQEPVFQDKHFYCEQGSFVMLKQLATQQNILGKVSGILFDLGVSSPQLDDSERGFSFLKDGPLDMRMDTTQGLTAAQWINSAKESEIANVLYEYGEERFSRRIAAAIVKEREQRPITMTLQLAKIVADANPRWEKHKNPATRSFQAIRIFINQELQQIAQVLEQCVEILAVGGRLLVISFHSLEDRIVKQFIQKQSKGGEFPARLPILASEFHPLLKKIGSALKPGAVETQQNPRARSAILRIAEKIA
jgi:16S rRNA (cytosine1402-N4)-methyltransferase